MNDSSCVAVILGSILSALFATGGAANAAEPRVLLLGDSITYDGGWAVRIESALRAAPAFARAEIVNLGLPSETVSGLSEPGHAGGKFPRPSLRERLQRVLEAFKPTLVLTCYGMNDGLSQPLDAGRQEAFATGYGAVHAAILACGARHLVVTAPLYDANHPPGRQPYDEVLDAQATWLLARRTDGWEVVDIRPELRRAVAAALAADAQFVYARDKVHPGDQGHQFIAQALWPGLAKLLALPLATPFASGEALTALRKRHDLLKHAWLSATRHLRPGIPAGLPLAQAQVEAAALLEAYLGRR